GRVTIAQYFPGAVIRRNVIAGQGAGEGYPNFYPAGNFYPARLAQVGFADAGAGDYRLAAGSQFRGKATDGGDVGCDLDALTRATAGVARR
ncbi:MAG TPA: hypothetical protein VF508_05305, partial [Pyrinomonadaceae bacterium]